MKAIKILITSFIADDQPGFVECRFYDAHAKEQIVEEKVPVVTDKYLDSTSNYPQEGVIACEIIREWISPQGQKIITVDTSKPWGISAVDGTTQFDLLEGQLTEII